MHVMKLMSYVDSSKNQTIELNFEEREQLAKSLKITIDYTKNDDEINSEIQKAYDEEINKPMKNSDRRYERHLHGVKVVSDDEGNEIDLIDTIPDYSSQEMIDRDLEREETIHKIEVALGGKDEWVNIVVKVALDGDTVRDVARDLGQDENAVSHKYRRAIKKLKIFFEKPSDFGSSQG